MTKTKETGRRKSYGLRHRDLLLPVWTQEEEEKEEEEKRARERERERGEGEGEWGGGV